MIQERLKKVRGDMSQEAFGKRIGLSKFTISNYENAKQSITDRAISDICRVYGVRKEWLIDGEEPMYAEAGDSPLSRLTQQYHLSPAARHIIEIFINLPEKQRELFYDKIVETARVIVAQRAAASGEPAQDVPSYEEILVDLGLDTKKEPPTVEG